MFSKISIQARYNTHTLHTLPDFSKLAEPAQLACLRCTTHCLTYNKQQMYGAVQVTIALRAATEEEVEARQHKMDSLFGVADT